jgi:hypothetical protein
MTGTIKLFVIDMSTLEIAFGTAERGLSRRVAARPTDQNEEEIKRTLVFLFNERRKDVRW